MSAEQLAAGADEFVKHVRDTGQAVMVTDNGAPVAVLVTPGEFAVLQERRRFLAAIEEGLADADAGRTVTTDELKASLEHELGPIAWQ